MILVRQETYGHRIGRPEISNAHFREELIFLAGRAGPSLQVLRVWLTKAWERNSPIHISRSLPIPTIQS